MIEATKPKRKRKPRAPSENLIRRHDANPPSCTDADTYKGWRAHVIGAPVAGFCVDCTPERQGKMIIDGRCDHADIMFFKDDEGFIFGSRVNKAKEEK